MRVQIFSSLGLMKGLGMRLTETHIATLFMHSLVVCNPRENRFETSMHTYILNFMNAYTCS